MERLQLFVKQQQATCLYGRELYCGWCLLAFRCPLRLKAHVRSEHQHSCDLSRLELVKRSQCFTRLFSRDEQCFSALTTQNELENASKLGYFQTQEQQSSADSAVSNTSLPAFNSHSNNSDFSAKLSSASLNGDILNGDISSGVHAQTTVSKVICSCPACRSTFRCIQDYKNHLKRSQPCAKAKSFVESNCTQLSAGAFQCKICGRVGTHRSSMYKHVRAIHRSQYQFIVSGCKYCKKAFASRSGRYRHEKICEARFTLDAKLCRPDSERKDQTTSGGEQTTNEHLPTSAGSSQQADANVSSKTKFSSCTNAESDRMDKRTFPCVYCGQVFSWIGNRYRHQKICKYNKAIKSVAHPTRSNTETSSCNKERTVRHKKDIATKEISSMHAVSKMNAERCNSGNREPKYICRNCKRTYMSYSGLSKHKKICSYTPQESEDKPAQLSGGARNTSRSSNGGESGHGARRNRVKQMEFIRPRALSRKISFAPSANVKRKIHHARFVCKYCKQVLQSPYSCTRHELTCKKREKRLASKVRNRGLPDCHSESAEGIPSISFARCVKEEGGKKFACSLCGFSASSLVTVYNHMRTSTQLPMHSRNNADAIREMELKTLRMYCVENDAGRYSCLFCSSVCEYRRSIVHHIRQRHPIQLYGLVQKNFEPAVRFAD